MSDTTFSSGTVIASTWLQDVNDTVYNLRVSTPPATATSAGVAGTVTWDTNYIYVCVATNSWKRVAISAW